MAVTLEVLEKFADICDRKVMYIKSIVHVKYCYMAAQSMQLYIQNYHSFKTIQNRKIVTSLKF